MLKKLSTLPGFFARKKKKSNKQTNTKGYRVLDVIQKAVYP